MKNVWKAVGYFGVYFLVQFLMQSGFMMVAATVEGVNTEAGLLSYTAQRLLLITILSNLLVVGIFCLYFKLRKRKISEEVGAEKVGIKTYLMPVVLAFSFSFVWTLLTMDVKFANSIMIAQSETFYSAQIPYLGMVLKILALLVSAPIAEEFICRGIMITKLKQSYSDWIAVAVSAVIFGLMHLMAGGATLAVGAGLMGLVFGVIYVKTKSLWPAVVAHAFANLPDFILPVFGEMNAVVRWVMTAVSAVVFVVCMAKYVRGDKASA